MLDLIPVILTYAAMAVYLVALFLLTFILKRTRGRFKTTLILWLIIVIISLFRRALNLLNLADMLNNEIWDDLFAIVNSVLLLASMYILFKDIREMTDVKLSHSKEARLPPPKHSSFDRFERPEPPKKFEEEKQGPPEGKRRLRVVNGYVDFTED